MGIASRALVSGFAALLVLAVPAAAQTPPGLPPGLPGDLDDLLPKARQGELARFQLTVSGDQQGKLDFLWDPFPGTPCGLSSQGTINERWSFARGAGVVMEFRKLGGRVFLKRAGRQLGDAAFAAPGFVQRDASGTFKALGPAGCVTSPLTGPDCGKRYSVRSDLRLGWSGGRLTLRESGPAAQKKNPAEGCGLLPGQTAAFAQFDTAYPFLRRQSGRLTSRAIFKSKRNLKVELKGPFLGNPETPQGFTRLTETAGGESTVTLKRLARG